MGGVTKTVSKIFGGGGHGGGSTSGAKPTTTTSTSNSTVTTKPLVTSNSTAVAASSTPTQSAATTTPTTTTTTPTPTRVANDFVESTPTVTVPEAVPETSNLLDSSQTAIDAATSAAKRKKRGYGVSSVLGF